MTRSPLRVWLAEAAAVVGMGFGAWLIHNAFQPNADTPNLALLVLGALDILLCFLALSYFLRQRLREGEALPGRWIVVGVVVLAGFLGWIAALFIDSERLLAEEQQRVIIAPNEITVITQRQARWHAIGAAAVTGVVGIFGCLLVWLVFDRELRRSWKTRARLEQSETRFRTLIENHAEPLAVLDGAGCIVYANPAWQDAFRLEPDDLLGTPLLDRIHADDRARVLSAWQSRMNQGEISCRLSADYGVWHDVEMQATPVGHAASVPPRGGTLAACPTGETHGDALVVRFRDVRETPEFVPAVPVETPHDMVPLQHLQDTQTQLAELQRRHDSLRDKEQAARTELEHHRWLLGSHKEAGSDGILILSPRGQVLSWNPAFAQLWKLSEETLAAHTWLTIAAHMETLARSGWSDFSRAVAAKDSAQSDACWEMTLEGGKLLEVYSQVLRDHPGAITAVRFQFRDVTRHRELEAQVREHDEQAKDWQDRKKTYESSQREHEKRLKQLEKQLHERDQHREELEATLLDHQDRLHQLHRAHEDHAAALKSSKEATRRLASGVANEINNVLSVVLGNADVLRENLPKDHMAQNSVDEIRQAATRGTELSQRLLAFSRNHLLQMGPLNLNEQLAALEPKFRTALGHDVQLQWERAKEELWVKTDAHPLEQALMHLVNHARLHMPQGGTLTITASRAQLSRKDLTHTDMAPGAYIEVQLRDTGAGMDDETRAHVFDPYHPVAEGQKGDLALATAYGILRQSGGCIDVDSTKGEGSVWTILLPETTERPQQETQQQKESA